MRWTQTWARMDGVRRLMPDPEVNRVHLPPTFQHWTPLCHDSPCSLFGRVSPHWRGRCASPWRGHLGHPLACLVEISPVIGWACLPYSFVVTSCLSIRDVHDPSSGSRWMLSQLPFPLTEAAALGRLQIPRTHETPDHPAHSRSRHWQVMRLGMLD